MQTAIVAGAFSLVVAALMAINALSLTMDDPLDSPEFRSLQSALKRQPANEQLKDRIRQMDLQLRSEHFRRKDLLKTGSYLLAVGLALFVLAAKLAADLRKKLPAPAGDEFEGRRRRVGRAARWSVAAVGMIIGGAALIGARLLPVRPFGPTAEILQPPSPQEIAANWPRFRGPSGAGISAYSNIPTAWDGRSGAGIAWKTPVPLAGNSSPVVWSDRVFLTGADEKRREIYCFDAQDGRLLFTHAVDDVPAGPAKVPEIGEETGYASPTGATDGRRFYAIFANGDAACVDFDGRRIWARNLGAPDSAYGYASSLVMYRNFLLVLYDQGDAEGGKSLLYALDALSGRTVWQARRPVANSWATPIVIHAAGRDQLITLAEPYVISHSPASGEILWKVAGLASDVAPSPIFAGGLVLAVNPNYSLLAIRPDGRADVTETHVAWEAEQNVPDICSPVCDGELVFLLQSSGMLSCFELAAGKLLWQHDFDTSFRSSPSLAGGRLYLLSEEGVMYFVAAARKFEPLGKAELGEPSNCSPAFADGRIYIRGSDHLFCITAQAK